MGVGSITRPFSSQVAESRGATSELAGDNCTSFRGCKLVTTTRWDSGSALVGREVKVCGNKGAHGYFYLVTRGQKGHLSDD